MTKTIKVSDETYELIKDQLGEEEIKELGDLKDLIGEKYLFQCARYMYYGKVKSITPDYIELKDAQIVYETGDFNNKSPEQAEEPQSNIFVFRQSIEAFYKLKW